MMLTSSAGLEARAFLKLAIPLATAQLAQFAVGFVDTIMMGHLSTASLAAGGLASTTFQMLLTIITGFVMSVGVLAAEAHGAGKKDQLTGLARQGLWLSLLLAAPFMILLWEMTPLLRALHQPEAVINLAQHYFNGISWGVLPAIGFAMLRGYLAAFSLANVVTAIVTLGTVFNIVCNYVLGFGKLGFARMELLGLGLGSTLSLWLMFGLFAAYILRHPELSRYRFWRGWKHPNKVILRQLMAVGLPIAVTLTLELGMFLAVSYMAGSLGAEVLAAHQIAFQTMALIFMVPLGMSQAVTARVGLWFGRGSRAGVRLAGWVAIASAVTFLLFSALTLVIIRPVMIGLFIDLQNPQNAPVIELAMNLLLVSAIAQMIDGVQRVTMSALYGLQDTRVPMILSAIAFWGIGLTASYILCFLFNWGAVGLWIGQYTGVAVAAVIFVWRFHRLTRRLANTAE
ncbi:MAG: MATE family efflux transporter [Phormidesmis priestleyi]|uniref:Probable multidrug resistance protein NorM n=1 Tax=Phormidesmis priestleyi TaxID=268141 RepID=A0A2W4XZF8_9CYAN|nr:MAG: MATE family efflux transporter [Phormidesmis priestleyi]